MTAKAGKIVLASQQLNFSAQNLFRQTLPFKAIVRFTAVAENK